MTTATLTAEQVPSVLKYVNWAHRFRWGEELVIKPVSELNALHWTVVQVQKLKLNNLILFTLPIEWFENNCADDETDIFTQLYQTEITCMPYQQCHWCGRLDKDPRGHAFGHKGLSLCHLSACQTHSPTLSDHDSACCYRHWNRLRDALIRNFKNYKNDQEHITQLFLDFCEERLMINMQTSIPPRPEREKPKQWQHPWQNAENKQHFTIFVGDIPYKK